MYCCTNVLMKLWSKFTLNPLLYVHEDMEEGYNRCLPVM
jgi:hypothetical protein